MMCSTWKGIATWACGRWQYSQSPAALCSTASFVASSIPETSGKLLALEGLSGLEMKQREHVPDEDVVCQLFPLGRGELPFLIFLGQLVHAGLVRVAEVEGEDAPRRIRGEGA